MNIVTEEDRLKKCTYPGRGIVIGQTPDGGNLIQIYWIMGRSTNSRNRIFEADGEFIRTKAFDDSKLTDPSLIIYYPSKVINQYHIITNGDQTDTIYDWIKQGKSIEEALKTRSYEPDEPNYTPRISGVTDIKNHHYQLSILKTADNSRDNELKIFFNYSQFINGIGHCLTTYQGDGNPLPSFSGEPYPVRIFNKIEDNLEAFWSYLDEENRVSLMVKFINKMSEKHTIKIVNKLG